MPGKPTDAAHADALEPSPNLVLVVGMSGSGKTTVGRLLAQQLGWFYRDADDFHSATARAAMAAGQALTDTDREPWLDAIAAWLDHASATDLRAVVTCSALKRAYRDRLLRGRPGMRLVYLHGTPELIASRLAGRQDHFFPVGLLDSQIADFEEPEPDERPLVAEIDQPPEAIVDGLASLLRPSTGRGRPTGGRPEEPAPSEVVPASPTGEQWTLTWQGQQAVVVQLGAALRHYEVDGRPVLDGFASGAPITAGRGQVLVPWPNRIGDGRYTFDGADLQLPLTEPEKGNAIHGLLRWVPWRLQARSEEALRLAGVIRPQPGYPFLLDVTAEYRLGPAGLDVSVRATNVGDGPAPYGVGQHPYLTLGADTVDTALLTVPARQRFLTDDRGLPAGQEPVEGTDFDFRTARPIGSRQLDTAFALDRGDDDVAVVRLAHPSGTHGVDVRLGEGTRYVQIYTGDTLPETERRRGVAVEPMSCPPDSFRSGLGVQVLEKGDTHVLRWGLTAWRTT
ncbi:aldose epimerase family protein [Streptomyces poriferorum]|uniref:gluconokinase n=1 Tax=Streptomyces poriferorum TaxID=2798799 RepID=A0ABY9IIV7_9ACTN|nr:MULTISPECIES: gluconokinase, GntK/IdnK-type [unclassified Streptomyces]MDP5316219.1 gluconokinase, GntK/IdnK-type [Streptomyces sp. Alt4]WLQ54551.1 gluconokinase, GntK/IdnK-type [Streptomyces sp. Alt2]